MNNFDTLTPSEDKSMFPMPAQFESTEPPFEVAETPVPAEAPYFAPADATELAAQATAEATAQLTTQPEVAEPDEPQTAEAQDVRFEISPIEAQQRARHIGALMAAMRNPYLN
jgi:hypothetical protein